MTTYTWTAINHFLIAVLSEIKQDCSDGLIVISRLSDPPLPDHKDVSLKNGERISESLITCFWDISSPTLPCRQWYFSFEKTPPLKMNIITFALFGVWERITRSNSTRMKHVTLSATFVWTCMYNTCTTYIDIISRLSLPLAPTRCRQ